MVRQALNDRAMSSDRAAEVACHAERERWADTEIESVPGGTPNSGSATPVSPATLRRLRRQLDRWPSRWLAEEFQDLPEPVLQALAAARPLSLAHLSLLSSGLRAALDGESQMWDAFHAHTTGGVQKT